MQPSDEASPDISRFETLLNENWNERKRLIEDEFELRSEVQSLLLAGNSRETFETTRGREKECQAALTRNDEEYHSLIERWAAETFAVKN
jgi:hypothetical protein